MTEIDLAEIGLSNGDILLTAGAILFLIMMSGFFSGSETSLTAASAANMHKLNKEGNKRAGLVERLINDAESLIGAILLGNNLVNILATALATSLFTNLFGEVGVVYATFAMTALVLIFAEVMPKTYAISNPDRMALTVSPLINIIVILFSPVVRVVQAIVRGTLKIFGIDITDQQSVLSPHDEIRGAIYLQAHEGGLVREHKNMLDSILDLQNVSVEDVMVHRKSIEMINADDPLDDIFEQVVNSPYTRLPVWQEDQDNVIGVVHAKRLLEAVRKDGGSFDNVTLDNIMQKPWFVPETTTLQEQLNAFLQRKAHFALVVDEYGALMGITTLEDILEEIVGDIIDEYDDQADDISTNTDGSLMVEGTMPIRDLNRQFDWDLSDEEAVTIAGYVIMLAQSIPMPGETFIHEDFEFKVLKRRRNQIISIQITPPVAPS